MTNTGMADDCNGSVEVPNSPLNRRTLSQSPSKGHLERTPAASPAKLAPNHAIFMTNIDSSPTKRRSAVEESSHNPSSLSSSTRVIESLHEQIDTLTNTNLQLTMQSHNLLSKLEAAQQRESKLLENTASLKHENENIVSMLNRKTRKLKELEDACEALKADYDVLLGEQSRLQGRFQDASEKEQKLEQQIEMIQVQYNALVDSQEYYKRHYSSEVSTLKEQLESLKLEQRHQIERTSADADLLDEKIMEFNSKYSNFQHLDEIRLNHLENKCDDMVKELDLASWVSLYKESKNMVISYAQSMNVELSKDFERIIKDPSLMALEAKSQHTNTTTIPLNVAKVRNSRATTSLNANTFSNGAHPKRSSFYGGTKQFTASTIPGSLPGVKRSSSRRTNSGRSENSGSSAESSPVLRQDSRNASSPSPRMAPAASFRRG